MKRLFLFLTFFCAVSLSAFSQGTLTPEQLRDKADSLFKLDDRGATNRKVNVMTKALISNLGSGGSSTLANQVLAFGTVVAGDSTVVYNDITFRFGSTTYSLLDGTATIDVPDDDTTARIDLLVANSDGSITVLEGDPGNLTVPAYDVNSQLPITVILQNIGGNGSNTVIPYATTEQMNAGTAGKLPDAEKVKAYVDAAIEEALASIVIPGGGGGGSGYVPLTGSDSLSGNHRYATGSTIDTKNTGDTLNIGTVRAGGIRLGTTGSEIKFGTAANLKFYNVDGSSMTIGRGIGFGTKIEMDATGGSTGMDPLGFGGANGSNTISLRMSNGLIIANGSGTSQLTGTQMKIGNGSNSLTLQPLTLSANRTLYFPNRNDTIVTRSDLVGLGGGGGEANLGANLGAGVGVYASKVGATLNFRSLIAGTNISITNDANTITINNTQFGNPTASGSLQYLRRNAANNAYEFGALPSTTPDTIVYRTVANSLPLSSAVSLTGTQTLTNKTLTSPTINSPTGITKSDVGLANVDNTPDASKPVSTAQAAAIALKEDAANKSTSTSLGTSNTLFPTQNAVKTYADAKVSDAIADGVTTIAPSQNAVFDALVLKADATTVATNSANIASNTATITANTASIATKRGQLGTIYDVALNAASSTLYTDTSPQTNYTFTSGGITTSGGNNDALNFLEYSSYYTNLVFYTRKIRVTSTSDGNGIGMGIHSGNGDVLTRIITTTSGNRGKVLIDSYRSGVLTNRATSTAGLSYTNGDVIDLVFERNNTSYRITAYNVTTSTPTVPVFVSVEYVDPLTLGVGNTWAAGRAAIYHFGGNQTITSDTYIGREGVNNDIVIYGNSISAGFYAGGGEYMMYSVLKSSVANGVGLVAGGGNKTSDYANLKAEIFSLKPKIILFCDGINDIINGVSAATTQANILAFIADCQAAGVMPILSEVLPISSAYTPASGTNATAQAAIDALNTWMNTLGVKVVAANAVLKSGGSLNNIYDGGDGLHINAFGNLIWGNSIIGRVKYVVNTTPIPIFGYSAPANAGVTYNLTNGVAGTGSSISLRTTSDAAQGFFGTYSSLHSTYPNKTLLSNNNTGLIIAAGGASGALEFLTGGLTIGTNKKMTIDNVGNITASGDPGNNPLTLSFQNSNAGGAANSSATANIVLKSLSSGANANIKITNDAGLVSQISSAGSASALTNFFTAGSSLWFTNIQNMYLGNSHVSGNVQFFTGGSSSAFVRGNISTAGNWRIGDNATATGKLNVYQSSLGTAVTRWESAATTNNVLSTVFQNKVTTTDATVTTLHTFATGTDVRYTLMLTVTAKRTGGASGATQDGASYIIAVPVKNNGGTVTVGTPVSLLTLEDQPAWDITFTPSGTNVLIQVTGAAANNISWTLNKLEANEGNN